MVLYRIQIAPRAFARPARPVAATRSRARSRRPRASRGGGRRGCRRRRRRLSETRPTSQLCLHVIFHRFRIRREHVRERQHRSPDDGGQDQAHRQRPRGFAAAILK